MSGCESKDDSPTAAELQKRVAEHVDSRAWAAAIIELKNFLERTPDDFAARMQLGEIYLQTGYPVLARSEFERAHAIDKSSIPAQFGLVRAQVEERDIASADAAFRAIEGPITPDRQVLEATVRIGQEKFEEAGKLLDAVLASDPGHAEAHLARGNLALSTDKLDIAEQEAAWLAEHAAGDVRSAVLMGELRLLQGRAAEAADSFAKAAELMPTHPMANYALAKAAVLAGRYEVASQTADHLRKLASKSTMVEFIDGYLAFAKGDFKVAKEKLLLVLKIMPSHAQSQALMAEILLSERQFEQASAYLEVLSARFPADARIARLLAIARIQGNEAKKAIDVISPVAEKTGSPQDLALLGRAYLTSGDVLRGRDLIKKATAEAPDNATLNLQLGAIDLSLGKYSSAAVSLERGVSGRQAPAEDHVMLIYAYIESGDFDKADAVTRKLMELYPKDPLSYNLAGGVALSRKDISGARARFEQALERDPGYHPALLNLAGLDLQEGRRKEARARYERVLKDNPGTVDALTGLGRVLAAEGDRNGARENFEKAYALLPDDQRVALTLAELLLDQKMADKAVPILERVGRRARNDARVAQLLARAYFATGQVDKAAEIVSSLGKAGKGDSNQLDLALGVARGRQGDTKGAKAALNAASKEAETKVFAQIALASLAIGSGDFAEAKAHIAALETDKIGRGVVPGLRGDLAFSQKEYSAAADFYAQILKTTPNEQYAVKRHLALARAGKRADALNATEAWLKEHPEQVAPRMAVAEGYMREGKLDEAITHLKTVLESDPANVAVLNNLALCYSRRGDDGVPAAKQAYELAPENPSIADTYGWLLVQAGRTEEGLTLLEKALAGASKRQSEEPDPAIRYHLAVAYLNAKARDRAVEQLRAALAAKGDFYERKAAHELLASLTQ